MQILDRLKGMVGIGAPTLEITVDQPTVCAGDVLRGRLVLLGGALEVPIADLSLRLEEQHLTYTTPSAGVDPDRQTVRRVAAEPLPLAGRALESGERLELPFAMTLPLDLEPTAGPRCYALIAEAEIPGLNARAELPVVLTQ